MDCPNDVSSAWNSGKPVTRIDNRICDREKSAYGQAPKRRALTCVLIDLPSVVVTKEPSEVSPWNVVTLSIPGPQLTVYNAQNRAEGDFWRWVADISASTASRAALARTEKTGRRCRPVWSGEREGEPVRARSLPWLCAVLGVQAIRGLRHPWVPLTSLRRVPLFSNSRADSKSTFLSHFDTRSHCESGDSQCAHVDILQIARNGGKPSTFSRTKILVNANVPAKDGPTQPVYSGHCANVADKLQDRGNASGEGIWKRRNVGNGDGCIAE